MKYLDIKQPSHQLTKQSTKKSLINKISVRLLWLEFKSGNTLKLKAINYITTRLWIKLTDFAEKIK